jgi:hypothetical protein
MSRRYIQICQQIAGEAQAGRSTDRERIERNLKQYAA